MSSTGAYRSLLRSLRGTLGDSNREYFVEFVRREFKESARSGDHVDVQAKLRMAKEYSEHLVKSVEHASILRRYNITVSRDGSQKDNVKAIANKVGLTVPSGELE